MQVDLLRDSLKAEEKQAQQQPYVPGGLIMALGWPSGGLRVHGHMVNRVAILRCSLWSLEGEGSMKTCWMNLMCITSLLLPGFSPILN